MGTFQVSSRSVDRHVAVSWGALSLCVQSCVVYKDLLLHWNGKSSFLAILPCLPVRGREHQSILPTASSPKSRNISIARGSLILLAQASGNCSSVVRGVEQSFKISIPERPILTHHLSVICAQQIIELF